MYYISSNADWSGSTCFFYCYISINCLYISGVYSRCIISSNADRIDSLFSFVIYQSTACILVKCTQNVLYILQRQSERLALSVCYISINCLYISGAYPKCIIYHPTPIGVTRRPFSFVIYESTAYWSGVYPKYIIYHPTPIGATCAFHLLYINQLPV
jgi:hypothetical protein